MTDQDRRPTATDASHARGDGQQQQAGDPHSHVSDRFAEALGTVIRAASRLPQCDQAAKLHAAIARLTDTTDTQEARDAARALVSASELALADDPWWLLHQAATAVVAIVCEP